MRQQWFGFLAFIGFLLVCTFLQCIHERVERKKDVSVIRMQGTSTITGKVDSIKKNDTGFSICVNNPERGKVVADVGPKAFVVFQNHNTHQRIELNPVNVREWVDANILPYKLNAAVGMYKDEVTDVILALID